MRRRQLEEGYEVPMDFSFRRSKKGDSVVASTTRVDRNASGNRVAVTNDEIVAAKPRGGGKSYGIWKQRPIGGAEAGRATATVAPVNYSSRRDRLSNTMRTSPASPTRLMPQQIPFRHKPEAIERPDADTRISDRLHGMQAMQKMKSTVGNMVRDARAGMSSMSDAVRPGGDRMADRPRPKRNIEW